MRLSYFNDDAGNSQPQGFCEQVWVYWECLMELAECLDHVGYATYAKHVLADAVKHNPELPDPAMALLRSASPEKLSDVLDSLLVDE